MTRFEKKILFDFLLKVLTNRKIFHQGFSDLCLWFEDRSGALLASLPMTRRMAKGLEELQDAKVGLFGGQDKKEEVRRLFLSVARRGAARLKNVPADLFERNLEILSGQLGLNRCEKRLVGFIARYQRGKWLENFFDKLDREFSDSFQLLALLLDESHADVARSLRHNGNLTRLGLVTPVKVCLNALHYELTPLFLEALFYGRGTPEGINKMLLGEPCRASLEWTDFSHLGEAPDRLVMFLNKALDKRLSGVNILLWGPPGTGKTEFCKTLANKLGLDLFSIGEMDDKGNEPSREERMAHLFLAQKILGKNSQSLLMFDEADDLFQLSIASVLFGEAKASGSKIFANRMLENNHTPVLWVLNDPKILDESFLRRMALAIEMTTPPREQRAKIWKRLLASRRVNLPEDEINNLACQNEVSPAVAKNAISFAKLVGGKAEQIRFATNGIIQVTQGGQKKEPPPVRTDHFRPELLNTDLDLETLTERITGNSENGRFTLCLNGPPGTGKSDYGKYLAGQLGMSIMLRRASDLIGSHIGETESNIASLFTRAKREHQFLILDEADSFLRDRKFAERVWEVSQVNEMLTWMEDHPLPFVCTTNLMETLDRAALRRFLFKIKFDYLSKEQARLAFEYFFGPPAPTALSDMECLAPGDFAVVAQKAKFLGVESDPEALLAFLGEEVAFREPDKPRVGFCM